VNILVTRETSGLREALWAHPEWWVVALGLGCWAPTVQHGIARWGHTLHHRAGFAAELVAWQVMVLAMMLPTIAYQARAVAWRSMADRRHVAIAGFVVGYMVPWTIFGVAAITAARPSWAAWPWVVAGSSLVATVWALIPLRERAMMMVHGYAPLLAPEGWQATRDAVTTGLVVAGYCVLACWPLMLVCAFSGHDLAAVVAGGAISAVESRSFRPPRRFVFLASAALAIFFAAR
jgi:predicted metal-binding membrane protein